MTAKQSAPVLFGKPMLPNWALLPMWHRDIGKLRVTVTNDRGMCIAGAGGWHSRIRKTPQAAANDAERFLRKLKRELERMGA